MALPTDMSIVSDKDLTSLSRTIERIKRIMNTMLSPLPLYSRNLVSKYATIECNIININVYALFIRYENNLENKSLLTLNKNVVW